MTVGRAFAEGAAKGRRRRRGTDDRRVGREQDHLEAAVALRGDRLCLSYLSVEASANPVDAFHLELLSARRDRY